MNLKLAKSVGIDSGQRVPLLYGRAYAHPDRFEYICYPVPLNVLIRWGRWLFYKLRNIEPVETQWYRRGYDDGWKAHTLRIAFYEEMERQRQEPRVRR